MTGVIDLGAERASRSADPQEIATGDLLRRVLRQIETSELQLSHAIVVTATTRPNLSTDIQVDHAGGYDRFGQFGMLTEALRILQNA